MLVCKQGQNSDDPDQTAKDNLHFHTGLLSPGELIPGRQRRTNLHLKSTSEQETARIHLISYSPVVRNLEDGPILKLHFWENDALAPGWLAYL